MTYDKIPKCRNGRTNQYGNHPVEETLLKRQNYSSACGTIWSFQEASIPLYSRGSEDKERVADSRAEGGIYCQAPCESGFSYQTICKIYWRFYKRHCDAGLGVISQKKGAWLRNVILKDKSKYFIVLIDWLHERFRKLIGFWFLRKSGLPVRT